MYVCIYRTSMSQLLSSEWGGTGIIKEEDCLGEEEGTAPGAVGDEDPDVQLGQEGAGFFVIAARRI